MLKLLASNYKLCRCYSTNNLTIEKLVKIFKKYDRPNYYEHLAKQHPAISKLKRASLLVPISLKEEHDSNGKKIAKTYFTLSKRTKNMRYYSDQICFIGGKRDQTDENDLETALREAHEEAGIEPANLKLLAQLNPFLGTNLGSEAFLITPFVFYFDKQTYKPNLNKDEVDCLFEMSTEEFLDARNHESNQITVFDQEYYLHYFHANDSNKTLFGVTAFVCILTSCALHQRAPEFATDPTFNLTPDNLNQFVDDYVLKKSLINVISNDK